MNVNVNSKLLLHLASQKFNTFTTFAKFANFNPALEYPPLIPRHAPRLGSLSERASRASPLSCLRRESGAGG
jgi:hypothetical protein